MTALSADLSLYLACLVKNIIKLYEDDKIFYYKLHKQIADRILECHSSNYSQILDVKKSIIEVIVVAIFNVLFNLLCSKGKIEVQYEPAQKAHDCQYDLLFLEILLTRARDMKDNQIF